MRIGSESPGLSKHAFVEAIMANAVLMPKNSTGKQVGLSRWFSTFCDASLSACEDRMVDLRDERKEGRRQGEAG